MNACKVMQAKSKSMMPTWLASCGVGAGCIWFHGAKKILSEIQYLNALVASTASEFLKHNKRAKDLDEHDSGSEDDPENFNLKTSSSGKNENNSERSVRINCKCKAKSWMRLRY